MGGVDRGSEFKSRLHGCTRSGQSSSFELKYHSRAEKQADARGISLRFPRFLKVRDDKNADEATSAEQVSCVIDEKTKHS